MRTRNREYGPSMPYQHSTGTLVTPRLPKGGQFVTRASHQSPSKKRPARKAQLRPRLARSFRLPNITHQPPHRINLRKVKLPQSLKQGRSAAKRFGGTIGGYESGTDNGGVTTKHTMDKRPLRPAIREQIVSLQEMVEKHEEWLKKLKKRLTRLRHDYQTLKAVIRKEFPT